PPTSTIPALRPCRSRCAARRRRAPWQSDRSGILDTIPVAEERVLPFGSTTAARRAVHTSRLATRAPQGDSSGPVGSTRNGTLGRRCLPHPQVVVPVPHFRFSFVFRCDLLQFESEVAEAKAAGRGSVCWIGYSTSQSLGAALTAAASRATRRAAAT